MGIQSLVLEKRQHLPCPACQQILEDILFQALQDQHCPHARTTSITGSLNHKQRLLPSHEVFGKGNDIISSAIGIALIV